MLSFENCLEIGKIKAKCFIIKTCRFTDPELQSKNGERRGGRLVLQSGGSADQEVVEEPGTLRLLRVHR
jgi:hypothetical protein